MPIVFLIDPIRDGYRWVTPRELARLQCVFHNIPVPADRFHAYAAIGNALSLLTAGLFLAKAATRFRCVPDAGPQSEEARMRERPRTTAPPLKPLAAGGNESTWFPPGCL